MYEHKTQRLLSRADFLARVGRHAIVAGVATAIALGLGVVGYHVLGGLAWIDAFVNASMILGGMGPVNPIDGPAGKIFAACYALFSGLFFLGVATVLVTPFVHRMLHRLHMDEDDDNSPWAPTDNPRGPG